MAIISAAISPRQAKPNPVRMPVTMLGSAPGSSTSVNIAHRPAPSDAAALRTCKGIVETPSSVLYVTMKNTALKITKVMAPKP